MLLHQDTLISVDVFQEKFICDLSKCKGACCVEGDLGAPLEEEELAILEKIRPEVEPYLSEQGKLEIQLQGEWVVDDEDDFSTPTIDGKECAYAYYDQKGVLKCGIEAAYNDGKIDFPKPISCHLYPVRLSKVGDYIALNYHQWDICAPACELGKALQTPVYAFLKDALIRRFGEEWYQELLDMIAGMGQDLPASK